MAITKWAVVGTSPFTRNFVVPAFHRARNAELRAIVSRSYNRAQEAGRELGLHGCTLDQLLDTDLIDALYIATPNATHHWIAMQGLTQGKHVLCEKPAWLDVEQAATAGAVARKNGLKVFSGYMYAHTSQTGRILSLLRQGAIGTPVTLTAEIHGPPMSTGDFRWIRELGGGALHDLGCYALDFIVRLTGGLPDESSVMARHEDDIDVVVTAALKYNDGPFAHVGASFWAPWTSAPLSLRGTEGELYADNPFNPGMREAGIVLRGRTEAYESFPPEDAYACMVEDVSFCILNSVDPPEADGLGMDTTRLLESVGQAVRNEIAQ